MRVALTVPCPLSTVPWHKAVDVRVNREEAVDIPQAQQKLGDAVFDRLLAVADARPRRLIGEEVPAEGVGAIAVEDLRRLAVVPLALGHLLPILAKHEAEDDAVAEG